MLNHSSSAQDLVILSATSVSLGPVLLCFLSTFIFPFFIREWVCHETRQKALRYQKRKRRKKDLVYQKKARCNAEVSGVQHEPGRDAWWVGRAHPEKPRARFLICKWGKWTLIWSQCSMVFPGLLILCVCTSLLQTVPLMMYNDSRDGGGCAWLSPTSPYLPPHLNLGLYLRINDLAVL